jgi:hypothetical protein
MKRSFIHESIMGFRFPRPCLVLLLSVNTRLSVSLLSGENIPGETLSLLHLVSQIISCPKLGHRPHSAFGQDQPTNGAVSLKE